MNATGGIFKANFKWRMDREKKKRVDRITQEVIAERAGRLVRIIPRELLTAATSIQQLPG